MEWQEFEELCKERLDRIKEELSEELGGDDIGKDLIKVKPQNTTTFSDGATKRVDFYIAEKRIGGRRYVLDCKHYPSGLRKREVDKTLEYKNRHNATGAFILLSDVSNLPESVEKYADEKEVKILKVDRSLSSRLPFVGWLFDDSELDELREEIKSNYLKWMNKNG